jgi:hypothetical protein
VLVGSVVDDVDDLDGCLVGGGLDVLDNSCHDGFLRVYSL